MSFLSNRAGIITERLKHLPTLIAAARSSYAKEELKAERRDLLRMRMATEDEQKAARGPDRETRSKNARTLDRLEAEERENTLAYVARLEAAGDHREARIWRLTLPRLREQIARRYHLEE